MNQPFSNPYFDYEAVSNLAMFFGRKQELQTLYRAIAKHQCVSIVGSRHIGKSSLLKFLGDAELQKQFQFHSPPFLFVFTDWRAYLEKTREDFFHQICERILVQSRVKIELSLSERLEGEDRFAKLLEDIHQANFYLVLLMDAFDQVTSNPAFDTRFFSYLRSLAGINNLVAYITATRKPLYQVCHSAEVAGSPFFNGFLPCYLGALMPDEARALIDLPARQAGCPFTPAEVEWVFEQAGPHPFFIQVVCRHLFDEKYQQPGKDIQLDRVQVLSFRELLPHIDRLWEELDEQQKEQMRQEVLQDIQSIAPLSEFSGSALFRRRVRSLSQDSLTRLTVDEVREALEHLDNMDFLGQCQLSKFQWVLSHPRKSMDASVHARGMLVRELLFKAFERMKRGEIRTDSSVACKGYNILWYRYFKYHLPNPQIAARLGVSVRQFYREQNTALQSLWKELLEIEAEVLDQMR